MFQKPYRHWLPKIELSTLILALMAWLFWVFPFEKDYDSWSNPISYAFCYVAFWLFPVWCGLIVGRSRFADGRKVTSFLRVLIIICLIDLFRMDSIIHERKFLWHYQVLFLLVSSIQFSIFAWLFPRTWRFTTIEKSNSLSLKSLFIWTFQVAILIVLLKAKLDQDVYFYDWHPWESLVATSLVFFLFPWGLIVGLLLRTQYLISWTLLFLGAPFWIALAFLLFANFFPEISAQLSWQYGLILFLLASFGVWSSCLVALVERHRILFSVSNHFFSIDRYVTSWQAEPKWLVYFIRVCASIWLGWAIWWSMLHLQNRIRYPNPEIAQQKLFASLTGIQATEAKTPYEFYLNHTIQNPQATNNFIIPLIEKMQPLDGDPDIDQVLYERLKIRKRAPEEFRLQTLYDWLIEQEYMPLREFERSSAAELTPDINAEDLLREIYPYFDVRDLYIFALSYSFDQSELPIAAEWATLMEPLVWELLELSDYTYFEDIHIAHEPLNFLTRIHYYDRHFAWILASLASQKIGIKDTESALRLTLGLLDTYNKRWNSDTSTIKGLSDDFKRFAFRCSAMIVRELDLTDAQFDSLISRWKAVELAESQTAEPTIEQLIVEIFDLYLNPGLGLEGSRYRKDMDWKTASNVFILQPWLIDWGFAGAKLRQEMLDAAHRVANPELHSFDSSPEDYDFTFSRDENSKNSFQQTLYALFSSPQYKGTWFLEFSEHYTDHLMASSTLKERVVLNTRFLIAGLLIERHRRKNDRFPQNLTDVLELTRVPLPRDWFVNEDLIYRINDEGSEYELIILSDPFDKFHNESGEKWRSDIDSYLPPKREKMFDDFPINRYIKRVESD